MTISVVVADDQALVRAGLVMVLEAEHGFAVVGEARDGVEAVQLARELHPDVLVMDVRMPNLDGIEATRQVTEETAASVDGSLVRVLVLTTFPDDEAVVGALRAGASGFVLKDAAPRDFVTAIRRVAAGDAYLDQAVAGQVIAALGTAFAGGPRRATVTELSELLTPRELEVLALMAQGASNADIRDHLVLSEATVKTHVSRVIMKTASRDRTEAVVLAYRTGLVTPGTYPRRGG